MKEHGDLLRVDRAVLLITFKHLSKPVRVTIREKAITVSVRSMTEEVRIFLRTRGFVIRELPSDQKAA